MLNAGTLLKALVDVMRDTPDLVTAIGGDRDSISAYYEGIPFGMNWAKAVSEMNSPSLLARWVGDSISTGGWRHDFQIAIRPPRSTSVDETAGPMGIWRAFISSKPASPVGNLLALWNYPIHSGCYPMTDARIEPQVIFLNPDGATLDYHQISLALTEIGDQS